MSNADQAFGLIDPATLKAWLHDGQELAIVDVREEETFSAAHLLHAANLPLSRLEAIAPDLLPRLSARIVVTDNGEGLAERAAGRLASFGYGNVHVLEDGNAAWLAGGYPLYSGVHVPSKAFAEVVEHELGTPWITAEELHRRTTAGERVTLIDARPFDEHNNHTVPGSTYVPGAELVLRVPDLVQSRDDLVVVHCGGRTRSIIGAQALISAGLPNRVVSLKDGTMAWALAGLDLNFGAERAPPKTVSPKARAWAEVAAARVAANAGVRSITRVELARWQAEAGERTLYVFDVRTPDEFAEGHVPGSVSAPGGQLVQETDSFVGILGARIVLIDDASQVRARVTAHWLLQLGWSEVAVLEGGLGQGALDVGSRRPQVLGLASLEDDDIERVAPAELAGLLAAGGIAVVDLGLSRRHKAGHVPGAWFAIRARLAARLAQLPPAATLVLTSEDGAIARLAAAELRAAGLAGVAGKPRLLLLGGGTDAWIAAALPVETGIERSIDVVDDVWFTPRQRPGDTVQHMNDYLDWEIKLLSDLEQDEDSRFRLRHLPAHA